MAWTISLIAFALVFFCCAAIAFFRSTNSEEPDKPIEGYLLANSKLKTTAVVNLLLSTSFGLNSLFFQVWLGYSIGAWALLIQATWAVGFILLSPFSSKIKSAGSLHEELGSHFTNTRRVAAIFSLIGIMFMMCWETQIGISVFSSLFKVFPPSLSPLGSHSPSILVWSVVIGTLFYTLIGGIRGNAKADIFLNVIKIIITIIVLVLLFNEFSEQDYAIVKNKFFPSIGTAIKNLGIFGLITSVVFSLSWQFVDNSTWQSLIAGQVDKPVGGALIRSGVIAFIAPGIIGTLLGVSLAVAKNVEPENSFGLLLSLLNDYKVFGLLAMAIVSISCLMSMLDGLFLTSAYTIFIDIANPTKSLQQIEEETTDSEADLLKIRGLLVLIAIVAIGGIGWLMNLMKVDIFSYVYFVVVSQLSLFGPVIISLTTKRRPKLSMSVVIIASAIAGFLSAIIGSILGLSYLQEGAGTFTALISLLLSFMNSSSHKVKNSVSI